LAAQPEVDRAAPRVGDCTAGQQQLQSFHFTTIDGEHTILSEHDFRISDAYSTSGDRIDGNSEMPSCPWFFVIARKIEA
jgi:hypothetical protein